MRPCVFLGYPQGQKGFRVFDLNKKRMVVSRDVSFVKCHFPFRNSEYDHIRKQPSQSPNYTFEPIFDDELQQPNIEGFVMPTTHQYGSQNFEMEQPTRNNNNDNKPNTNDNSDVEQT